MTQKSVYGYFIQVITFFSVSAGLLSLVDRATCASPEPGARLLEAGTVIPVRLNETLSSKDSRRGDTFTATLRVEERGNYSGLPAGTVVEGTVREVRRVREDQTGLIELDFHRVRFPGGRSYPVQGSLIGLDENSVSKMRDGRLVAKPARKNDRAAFVGAGAGIGLIVGLTQKRPVEDTLLGAGIGYLLGSLSKGYTRPREVVLKRGSEMGVRLERSFSYTGYEETDDRANEPERSGASEERVAPEIQEEEGESADQHVRPSRRKGDRPTRDEEESDKAHGKADSPRPRETPGHLQDGESLLDIGVLVDDHNVAFDADARPLLVDDRVLVPLRPVLKALGLRVRMENGGREGHISLGEGTVRVTSGSRIALLPDGRRMRLDAPAERRKGVLYVSLRLFAYLGDYRTEWDSLTRTAIIEGSGIRD